MTDLLPPPPPPPPPSTDVPPPTGSGRPPADVDAAGRPARTVWLVVGSVLAAALLGWGTLNVVALIAHEERVVEVDVSAADLAGVTVVEVRSGAGDVTISTAADDGSTSTAGAHVRSEVSEGLQSPDISIDVVGDRLVVRSSCSGAFTIWCSVDHEITVPSSLDVIVRADHGAVSVSGGFASVRAGADHGSVRVVDPAGPLDLRADHGDVRVEGATSGTVVVEADHGAVSLVFDRSPRRIEVSADHGSVDIVVPDDGTSYRIDVAGSNRAETIDVPTDPASDRAVRVDLDHGSLRVRHPG